MKKVLFLSLVIMLGMNLKPKPAYRIFTGEKGKAIDFEKMMAGLKDADVVFFGENHNDPICHWLELQVLKELGEVTGKDVVVGAEMFESDNQLILDEYLNGTIKEDQLVKEAKTWKNYKTDYAPLVNYAKEHNIPFIATNIPRRYASLVNRKGLDSLDELSTEAKQYIAPLPIEVDHELPTYKEIADMMKGHGAGGQSIVDAQAVKDATMAWFISENLPEGKVMYHINGSFHSKKKEGIIHYLKQYRPGLNIKTIHVVEQDDLDKLDEENLQLADYVIVVPSDMTKTY